MNLQEFVKRSIVEITQGMKEASKSINVEAKSSFEEGKRSIDFDVAVIAGEESSEKDGCMKSSIKVVNLVDSSYAKNRSSEVKNSTKSVSRLRFSIFVDTKRTSAHNLSG